MSHRFVYNPEILQPLFRRQYADPEFNQPACFLLLDSNALRDWVNKHLLFNQP